VRRRDRKRWKINHLISIKRDSGAPLARPLQQIADFGEEFFLRCRRGRIGRLFGLLRRIMFMPLTTMK